MSATDVTKEPVVDWGIRLFSYGLGAGLALAGTGLLVVERLTTGTVASLQIFLAPFAVIYFLFAANQIIQKLKKVPLP